MSRLLFGCAAAVAAAAVASSSSFDVHPAATKTLMVDDRPIPEPAEGEVRIRVVVSGVNPTDWKSRSGTTVGAPAEPTVPNHDGAGVIDKTGAGVPEDRAGERVWITFGR